MSLLSTFVWLFGPFIDYMATNHRSICMLVVVCPISFALRTVMGVRDWAIFMYYGKCTVKDHDTKVFDL